MEDDSYVPRDEEDTLAIPPPLVVRVVSSTTSTSSSRPSSPSSDKQDSFTWPRPGSTLPYDAQSPQPDRVLPSASPQPGSFIPPSSSPTSFARPNFPALDLSGRSLPFNTFQDLDGLSSASTAVAVAPAGGGPPPPPPGDCAVFFERWSSVGDRPPDWDPTSSKPYDLTPYILRNRTVAIKVVEEECGIALAPLQISVCLGWHSGNLYPHQITGHAWLSSPSPADFSHGFSLVLHPSTGFILVQGYHGLTTNPWFALTLWESAHPDLRVGFVATDGTARWTTAGDLATAGGAAVLAGDPRGEAVPGADTVQALREVLKLSAAFATDLNEISFDSLPSASSVAAHYFACIITHFFVREATSKVRLASSAISHRSLQVTLDWQKTIDDTLDEYGPSAFNTAAAENVPEVLPRIDFNVDLNGQTCQNQTGRCTAPGKLRRIQHPDGSLSYRCPACFMYIKRGAGGNGPDRVLDAINTTLSNGQPRQRITKRAIEVVENGGVRLKCSLCDEPSVSGTRDGGEYYCKLHGKSGQRHQQHRRCGIDNCPNPPVNGGLSTAASRCAAHDARRDECVESIIINGQSAFCKARIAYGRLAGMNTRRCPKHSQHNIEQHKCRKKMGWGGQEYGAQAVNSAAVARASWDRRCNAHLDELHEQKPGLKTEYEALLNGQDYVMEDVGGEDSEEMNEKMSFCTSPAPLPASLYPLPISSGEGSRSAGLERGFDLPVPQPLQYSLGNPSSSNMDLDLCGVSHFPPLPPPAAYPSLPTEPPTTHSPTFLDLFEPTTTPAVNTTREEAAQRTLRRKRDMTRPIRSPDGIYSVTLGVIREFNTSRKLRLGNAEKEEKVRLALRAKGYDIAGISRWVADGKPALDEGDACPYKLEGM